MDLDKLQAICEAATVGPWKYNTDSSQIDSFVSVDDGRRLDHGQKICNIESNKESNGIFIALARDQLPFMVAQFKRLGKEFDSRVKREEDLCARERAIAECDATVFRSVSKFFAREVISYFNGEPLPPLLEKKLRKMEVEMDIRFRRKKVKK